MGANSKIEWTDHTFNPWRGCTKVHTGCANCYAEKNYSVKMHGVKWGPNGNRVRLSDAGWREPLKWNREAEKAGERRRVFCASLADVFEDWQGMILDHHGNVMWNRDDIGVVSAGGTTLNGSQGDRLATMSDLRRELFALIEQTPHLDWLLLTKRPENVERMWPVDYIDTGDDIENEEERQFFAEGCVLKPLHNVWLGTSISDQVTADAFVPALLKCHGLCPVLFLSCEPLLGPIDFCERFEDGSHRSWLTGQYHGFSVNFNDGRKGRCETKDSRLPRIHWVIAGGEGGPSARPMHPDWARSLRNQCTAAGVPFFFKQWGEWKPISEMNEAEWQPYYVSNRKAKPHEGQEAIDELYGRRCTIPTAHVRYDGDFGNGLRFCESIDGHWGYQIFRVGKAAAGRQLDVRTWDEFPQPNHSAATSAAEAT